MIVGARVGTRASASREDTEPAASPPTKERRGFNPYLSFISFSFLYPLWQLLSSMRLSSKISVSNAS